MTKRIQSPGKCNLCGKTYKKAGMSRHLKTCLEQNVDKKPGKVTRKTFWLNIQGREYSEYWLHLEIPTTSTLMDLDQFLRDIWLECCGHLSAFTIENIRYELDTGMIDSMWGDFFGPSMPVKTMKERLHSVLRPGLEFYHEYDFGTTTYLKLKVMAERERPGRSKKIELLALNHPPEIPCAKCGKPATQVCTQCIYEGPQAWLCDEHSQNHQCGEDMFLPVVNSPRVGECGYTGESY